MTMTGKRNNDNGLQDWRTEHQAVTSGIFYCRESANLKDCGSLQTSSWLDRDVLRNRQQKHTASRCMQVKKTTTNWRINTIKD